MSPILVPKWESRNVTGVHFCFANKLCSRVRGMAVDGQSDKGDIDSACIWGRESGH